MQLFLHIGAEKTGTSSLQQFFRLNREKLKTASFLYSETAGVESHTALAAAAQSDHKVDDLRILRGIGTPAQAREFRDSFTQQLAEEAQNAGCARSVLSSEHLSSRLTSAVEVETLAKMLRGIADSITVIVYLRRQDEFLCSTYSTDVKSGFTGPMRVPGEGLRQERYDYYALLERWASVFGKENIVCRLYEKSRLTRGDVVDDFADLIGLSLAADYVRPPPINESLDVTALEFLRLFNATVPRIANGALNPARGNIVQALTKVSTGPRPTLSDALLRDFMRYFERSNRRVALEYFGAVAKAGDPLFGEEGGSDRAKAQMQPLTAEQAVALAARLWERKQEYIIRQAEKIAHLEKRVQRFEQTGQKNEKRDRATLEDDKTGKLAAAETKLD